jgi:hypothetical protein
MARAMAKHIALYRCHSQRTLVTTDGGGGGTGAKGHPAIARVGGGAATFGKLHHTVKHGPFCSKGEEVHVEPAANSKQFPACYITLYSYVRTQEPKNIHVHLHCKGEERRTYLDPSEKKNNLQSRDGNVVQQRVNFPCVG